MDLRVLYTFGFVGSVDVGPSYNHVILFIRFVLTTVHYAMDV